MSNTRKRFDAESAAREFQRVEQTICTIRDELRSQQKVMSELLAQCSAAAPSDDKSYPNLPAILEGLVNDLHTYEEAFKRYQLRIRSGSLRLAGFTKFSDLSEHEKANLAHLDASLVRVTDRIHEAAQDIEADLNERRERPDDRLWDYEIETQFHFVMREDDPDYLENGDNFIASIRQWLIRSDGQFCGRVLPGADWPEGGEFLPMPHGRLFHRLYKYGSPAMGSIDFLELLRIGAVWVEVVVRHQYYYDLVLGRWIKDWVGEGEASPTA